MEKRLEQLVTEKDMIGTQLVKKNDIISHQDAKIRMLELTLERGEKQYRQRLDDIKLLRLEINRLRREKNLLARGIENITDLRLEVFNLERDLNRERQRVRALEEALETPLNIHRWRKLQSTDPTNLEMLDKIKILQIKLLDKAHKIALLEKENTALKESINLGKTDPELREEIARNKKQIFNQQEKIKGLTAELNMREVQLEDYKIDLDNVKTDLRKLKEAVCFKKGETFPHSPARAPKAQCKRSDQSVESATSAKFLGGGFKVTPCTPTPSLNKAGCA